MEMKPSTANRDLILDLPTNPEIDRCIYTSIAKLTDRLSILLNHSFTILIGDSSNWIIVVRWFYLLQLGRISGGSRIIIRRGFLLPLDNFSFFSQRIHIKKL